MKRVTTNITFGQILFILLTVVFASLMSFYLGAKFGPRLLNMGERPLSFDDPILPDERLAREIKELLKTRKHAFVFHEALQDEKDLKGLNRHGTDQKSSPRADKTGKAGIKKDAAKTLADKVVVKKMDNIRVKLAPPTLIKAGDDQSPDVPVEPAPAPVYWLQLGSYSSKKAAEKARKKWQKRGYSVSIVKTHIEGKGHWYRLQLGHYGNVSEVLKAQNRIMQKYRMSTRVVKSRK